MATDAEEMELEQLMQQLLGLKMDSPRGGDDAHSAAAAAATPSSCVNHAQWADHLFDVMNGAADAGDAKARAASVLEAFEGTAVAASRAERDVAVSQNALLKKAVVNLYRMYNEEKAKKQKLQCMVARSYDKAKKLENENYALAVQLAQAQQHGGFLDGHFDRRIS